MRPKQGKPSQVKGFDVIDTDRLGNIESQKLAEMMHKGALTIVYAHMMSLANLQDGWLAHTLSTGVKEEETVPDFESLFGGKDDAFRFDA